VNIGYLTEDPARDYAKGLTAATTLDELLKHIGLYDRVAGDAIETASKMTADQFEEFRDGLRKERRGKFAGEDFAIKYGDILMPRVMFKVSMVAEHFKAPWGCVYIRLCDVGQIIEKNGIAELVQHPSA